MGSAARETSLSPQLQFKAQSVQFGLIYDFYIENLNILPTNTLIKKCVLAVQQKSFGFPTHGTVLIYIRIYIEQSAGLFEQERFVFFSKFFNRCQKESREESKMACLQTVRVRGALER